MIRFVESSGSQYRILKMNEAGCWLVACDDPAAPFFVSALGMDAYQRIETPEEFLQHWGKEVVTAAEQKRLELIQPLLDDELCIADKAHRLSLAKEIAVKSGTTGRRVLRLYYRYLATGIFVESKERHAQNKPDYDWAIRTFYFSSKKFSLRAAYEMMLVQRFTGPDGVLQEGYPSWSSFEHYFYRKGYHKQPQKIISREGLSNYQRNYRPMYGTSAAWRTQVGAYQMDATEADIYLVSRLDRSVVIGRPYIYLAVDTATELIAGIYVGMDAGETAMLKCLANAASDKVSFCQEYGIMIDSSQWPNKGMPHELITDKGRDFCSKRVEELCIRYGVELQSLPPFRPDGKGLVEKSFDLLQQRYKPLLRGHGVIEPDAQECWATDYREQAVLDIRQFMEVLVHCVVYLNNGRVLPSGKAPAELWNASERRLLAVDEQELRLLTLPRERVKLTRRGIHFNGLWYVPEETERFSSGDSYLIATDKEDSTCIFIVEEGKHYPCLLARNCMRYKNLTEQEIKAAKKAERLQRASKKQAQSETGVSTTRAIREIVDKAIAEDQHSKI